MNLQRTKAGVDRNPRFMYPLFHLHIQVKQTYFVFGAIDNEQITIGVVSI